MRPPRQPGPLSDPIASDVAYAVATVALTRNAAEGGVGGGIPPLPATQVAGLAVAAAAPFIVRDLLREVSREPWWRRRRLLRALLTEAERRTIEQGVIG